MTEERNRPELDGEVDSLVTRTYKEVASELAPEHLDQAVLKQAANAARPRYLKSISWTRPMAWAATITLCVGLVLEITKAPVPVSTENSLPTDRIEVSESKLGEFELAPVKTNAPQTMVEEEREIPVKRKRAAKMTMDLRQKNEVMPDGAGTFALADAPDPSLPACSETDIATPESWLLCIERLENAGRTDEANEQRALYEAAFPVDEPF